MLLEVADISLSLHIWSEGCPEEQAPITHPVCRYNCLSKDLLREYWGRTEIWGLCCLDNYRVFIRMLRWWLFPLKQYCKPWEVLGKIWSRERIVPWSVDNYYVVVSQLNTENPNDF